MKILVSEITIVLAVSFACSQTTRPATAPATTQAGEQVDPAVEKILDAMEAAAHKHKTILAEVTYEVKNPAMGDVEVRTGNVMYQKENEKDFTRFRIDFKTLQQGTVAGKNEPPQLGAKVAEQMTYAFGPDADGTQWLSIADPTNKKLTQVQVARVGQELDPLRIGKGPFPLPFGQKTKDVLECCTVTTAPVKAEDLKGTSHDPKDIVYLHLKAKPECRDRLNFETLDMWIDRTLNVPVKMISTAPRGRTISTAVFEKIQTNQKIDASQFKLAREPGWTLESKPLNSEK